MFSFSESSCVVKEILGLACHMVHFLKKTLGRSYLWEGQEGSGGSPGGGQGIAMLIERNA